MIVESIDAARTPPLALDTRASMTAQPIGQPEFAEWLANSVTHVDRTLVDADRTVADFALDGSAPPHQVMMVLEEARMSLQLALQVRARLVEGYQELMRMQL